MLNSLFYIAIKLNFFHCVSQNITLFMLTHLSSINYRDVLKNISLYRIQRKHAIWWCPRKSPTFNLVVFLLTE